MWWEKHFRAEGSKKSNTRNELFKCHWKIDEGAERSKPQDFLEMLTLHD